jgi:ribose transport system substrate-binding protein
MGIKLSKPAKAKASIALLSAALLTLAGCASAPAPTASETSSSTDTSTETTVEKFVVGFSEPLGGQAWRETGLAALQALANRPEYRDIVEVRVVRTNDNDAAAQNAAMLNFVAEGVDAILFDPASSSGADAAVAAALANGIPVMAVGGVYDNEEVYVVSPDYNSAGAIGVQWLLDNLGDNKTVAVLEGLPGVPLNDGAMPYLIAALEEGGAKVVAQSTNGWNEATAQENMAAILRSNPDIGGVYSFLAGGQGAPEAFAAAGIPFVPTVGGSGYNGEACTLAEYKDQGLRANNVFAQPAIYAKGLAEILRLLNGETLDREQYFPVLQITVDNADEYCLADYSANYQLGYNFPGLDITAEESDTWYLK